MAAMGSSLSHLSSATPLPPDHQLPALLIASPCEFSPSPAPMATRRQIHIAVAHQHDNEGCKICQDKFGESGSGGNGARRGTSQSGTSTPARSSSRRRSTPNPFAQESLEAGSLPVLPRFPRSQSDPNTSLNAFGDILNVAFMPRNAVPRHTFVFSADVHPATSPRTHHHHNASLTPAQLAAHAFGPPAKGYNFGDEGGVSPWPDCEQDGSSSVAGYAQSEDRKKRRRSKLRYDLTQSLDMDKLSDSPPPSLTISLPTLEQSSSGSSPSSSSNGELMDESLVPSGSRSSFGASSEDKMDTSPSPSTQNLIATNELKTLHGRATIPSSSSAPTILQDTSTAKKRKRRSYQFRSSYHPLLRSEMLSLTPSRSTTTSSTPSLMPSSPNLSVSGAQFTSSTSPFPQTLSSASNSSSSLSGYPMDPPLTISELDLFGGGVMRELVDWGTPPPASITELQRTWRRSERAPLPPRVRRFQKMLELEQRPSEQDLDVAIPASQPALPSTSEDVEMSIAQ